jgi:hypothetical protein
MYLYNIYRNNIDGSDTDSNMSLTWHSLIPWQTKTNGESNKTFNDNVNDNSKSVVSNNVMFWMIEYPHILLKKYISSL